MNSQTSNFTTVIETIYGLSLDEKVEIKDLLENNISDARRDLILSNYKKAKAEEKAGKLKFSSKISELKKML